MKKTLVLLWAIMAYTVSFSQVPSRYLQILTNDKMELFPLSSVDSVIHSDGYVNVYINDMTEKNYEISSIDSVTFKVLGYSYIPSDAIEGWNEGIITESDYYALVREDFENSQYECYINGINKGNGKGLLIVFDDNLNIKQAVTEHWVCTISIDNDNEKVRAIIISKDGVSLAEFEFPYSMFTTPSPVMTRAKTAKRAPLDMNTILNAVNKFRDFQSYNDAFNSFLDGDIKGALTDIAGNLLGKLLGGKSPGAGFATSLWWDWLKGLGDEAKERFITNYLGQASVTIQDVERINSNEYRIHLYVSGMETVPTPDLGGKRKVELGLAVSKKTKNVSLQNKELYFTPSQPLIQSNGPQSIDVWVESNYTYYIVGCLIPIAESPFAGPVEIESATRYSNKERINGFDGYIKEFKQISAEHSYETVTFLGKATGVLQTIDDIDSWGVYVLKENGEYLHFPSIYNSYTEEVEVSLDVRKSDFGYLNYHEFNALYPLKIGIFKKYTIANGSSYNMYGEPIDIQFIYDEKPSVTFTSAQITGVNSYPQYDDEGEYQYTYYSAPLLFNFDVKGSLWMSYIQSHVYSNSGWTDNEGSIEIVDNRSYSNPSGMSYYNDSDMNFTYYYMIHLGNGSTLNSTNSVVFGGTPEHPTVSVGGAPNRSRSNRSLKMVSRNGQPQEYIGKLYCPRK